MRESAHYLHDRFKKKIALKSLFKCRPIDLILPNTGTVSKLQKYSNVPTYKTRTYTRRKPHYTF